MHKNRKAAHRMINTKVTQTVQGALKLSEYEITLDENHIIGKAQAELDGLKQKIRYQGSSGIYSLRYGIEQGVQICWIFDDRDEKIGRFSIAGHKGGFLNMGFPYTHAYMPAQEYNIYKVPYGKEGIYYPCYIRQEKEDGRQVGLIHKPALVMDLKDEYICYAMDWEHMLVLHLFSLYTDILTYRNSGKGASGVKQYQYSYSFNKQLKSKYNPGFLSGESKE